MNNSLNKHFGGAILKAAILKEQFKVSCTKMHFLREQFGISTMFWNLFWISDSRLLLISVAFVKVYSHLCAPIFIFSLSARTCFHSCLFVWMLKHQKYWYSFCWKHCDINNFLTEPWILIFITITVLQQNYEYYLPWQTFRTFKTQIMTKTRALIKLELHGSVAEWIKHQASDMFIYCEKSSNPVRGRFFINRPAVTLK